MDDWPRQHRLSPREREALTWICRGKTHAETATILGLSLGTVKTNLDAARYKLNAVNLTQAGVLAVLYGEITADDVLKGGDRVWRDRNVGQHTP